MVKATQITFVRDTQLGKLFGVTDGRGFWVKEYQNGNLVIDTLCGDDIHSIARLVEGCFKVGSNASEKLSEAYSTDDILSQVSFDFNDIKITATASTTSDDIVKQLYDGYEVLRVKREAEHEEYKKTPQYAIDMQNKRKKEAERTALTEDVRHIDKTTELEFKDTEAEKQWNEFANVNSDGYGNTVVNYARMWAKYMQYKMSTGEKLIDIANPTSHAADIEGITGFMYGCAVNILSQVWKYGEELRRWHNKSWGYNGVGVVNPAILKI